MTRSKRLSISSTLAFSVFTFGCGSHQDESAPAACSVEQQTGCSDGQVCEVAPNQQTACFAPVSIEGKVVVATDPTKPIEGARVIARDDNGAAVANVAITAADGTYSLNVPAPRDAAGQPLGTTYTLRADASTYETFPGGLRVALPVDVKDAAGTPPVVENASTTIGLYPLANSASLGSISGTVRTDRAGGVLVVADNGTAHQSGIADKSGAYTIFNVPAGSYEVNGYAAGINLTPAKADVSAPSQTQGVDLIASTNALGSVTGTIGIVNAPGGSVTSVVLAVEATFNENLGRGEVPRGLRVGNVSSAFVIDGVPDGRYVVLAAFEDDKLVRDPDTSIGNTATLHVAVAGAPLDAGNFKVTEALAVISPGATGAEAVPMPPTFVWADDSSEDHYDLQVFDTFGTLVWRNENVPSVKGSMNVSVSYSGPPLTAGQYYQFRATSMKSAVPISRTEDLLGVLIAK
jgi:hypothetical protein